MNQTPSPPAPLPPAGEGSCSLEGLGVLVTRPAHQAGPLCQWIEREGGVAIRCPTLSIVEPHDWTPALAIFDRLTDGQLIIFTSVNAVDQALPPIRERGGFPPGLDIAAIGQATSMALAWQGVTHAIHPEQGFTSEALLALPRFQNVAGQRIVIVRGEGGRELLAETLTARGAHVECAQVYRRERPAIDADALLKRWARGDIGAVVMTSIESLRNLFDMLGRAGKPYLCETPLIVVSARIQERAAEYGCRQPMLAREASDAAIMATLRRLTTNSSTSVR